MRSHAFISLVVLLYSGIPSLADHGRSGPTYDASLHVAGIAASEATYGAGSQAANFVGRTESGTDSCMLVQHADISPVPRSAAEPSIPLRHQIGQILIAGFEGSSPGSRRFRNFVRFAEDSQLGGVLFLGKNISSRSDTQEMIHTLRSKMRVSPFFAIDQEGGVIQRLTGDVGFPNIPSAKIVGATLSPSQAQYLYSGLAAELADWGFDMNIGPVVDLDSNPNNPIIGKLGRSYSRKPGIVAAYARAFVEAHGSFGIVSVLKHFPGQGSAKVDSHVAKVDVSATWSSLELEPYRALSTSEAPYAIMTGHLTLDRKPDAAFGKLPASLSSTMIHRLIRNDLCFRGVVVTDDIRMKALQDAGSVNSVVVRAITAGNDLIIVSSKPYDRPQFFDSLVSYVEKEAKGDAALRSRIGEAYNRVRTLKNQVLVPTYESQQRRGSAAGKPGWIQQLEAISATIPAWAVDR